MFSFLSPLIDILRDPAWQGGIGIIISALVGVLGVVLPLLPPRKIITYQFVSDAPILEIQIDFVTSDRAKDIIEKLHYISFDLMSQKAIAAYQQSIETSPSPTKAC